MFFLRRRRVFIGECDGQAVYYDQKTGEALAAPKSRLLNTEKAGDTNSFIPDLVILLLAGGPAVSGFFSLKFVGVYNWFSLACIKNWMNKSHEITRICLEHENILLIASCSIVQIVNRRFL